jgi:hypothetical protein
LAEDPNELTEKFALQEYAGIQEKMKSSVEDLHRVETVFPVAIGAFYVWLIKDGRTFALAEGFIFLIPVFIPVLGLVRHLARMHYISLLESYLREVEKKHLVAVGLGWETFYEREKKDSLQIRYKKLRIGVWMQLIVMTSIISCFLWLGSGPTEGGHQAPHAQVGWIGEATPLWVARRSDSGTQLCQRCAH